MAIGERQDPDAAEPVVVDGVSRAFGRRVALRGASLRVAPASIVGVAGPNGAGKSTLLAILAGLLRVDGGRARVFGRDPWHHRAAVMRRARFAFAPPGLWDVLTTREHLRAAARLSGARLRPAEIDAALELVGLERRADEPCARLSFGMRQRLSLAIALTPRPELLVLDEPAEGLDPLATLELRRVLARLRDEHRVAVLLSSHLLLELDALVDELVVLDRGEVLCAGAPAALRGAARVRIEVNDAVAAAAALRGVGVAAAADGDGALWLRDATPTLTQTQALLAAGGIELRAFTVARPGLEQVLRERLRARRQEAAAP